MNLINKMVEISHKRECPILESEHLILRPLRQNDDHAILSLRSHPEVFKYVDAKPYQDIERAQKFIKAVKKDIREDEAYFWGITYKEEDYVIGTICIWNFEQNKTKAEMGYELHPTFQHKGVMREAVESVIAFMERELIPIKIDAITHEDNLPSIRLLDYFSFELLGRAIEIDPLIEEGAEMLLYRKNIK